MPTVALLVLSAQCVSDTPGVCLSRWLSEKEHLLLKDALTTFVSLAEGYWPAYTQIDGPAPADEASDDRKRLLKQRMAVARRVQASLSSYGRSSAQYSRFDSLEK